LKGKALEVYSLLTETEARDYRQLKTALLRKYQLTIEGFRNTSTQQGESEKKQLYSLSVE